jgi:hypothetical protein
MDLWDVGSASHRLVNGCRRWNAWERPSLSALSAAPRETMTAYIRLSLLHAVGCRRMTRAETEVGLSIIAIESPNGDPVHGWLCFRLPVALCVPAPLREIFTAWIRLSRDLACDRPTSPKAHLDIAPSGTGWRRPRRRSKSIPNGDEDIAAPNPFQKGALSRCAPSPR